MIILSRINTFLGAEINLSKLLLPPHIPKCTSWTDHSKFASFIPNALDSSVTKADSLAHLAISWSSHHSSLNQSSKLLLSDKQWEKSTIGEVRTRLKSIMDNGTQYLFKNSLIRFQILKDLTCRRKSHKNISEYQNLLNYRRIVSHLGSKIDFIKLEVSDQYISKNHPLVKKVIADIGTLLGYLKSRDTSIVFSMKDGSCAFTVPFGMNSHPISLLFILDPKGHFHLRIFNKGMQPERNPFLRDPRIINLNEKAYHKNDILISNINPGFLFSPDFFSALIYERCTKAGSLDKTYRLIQEYAVHHGKGKVIESPEEIIYQKAKDQIFRMTSVKTMESQSKKARITQSHMALNSPFYHEIMTIGACFEANVATPEEFIASPEALSDVKSYSLQVIADSLRPQMKTNSHKLSLSLVEKRISIIQSKREALKDAEAPEQPSSFLDID